MFFNDHDDEDTRTFGLESLKHDVMIHFLGCVGVCRRC